MKHKFFADNFNDRRMWSWDNGEYVTDNQPEIEELKGLGVRFEIVEEAKEEPKQKRTRKKKVD